MYIYKWDKHTIKNTAYVVVKFSSYKKAHNHTDAIAI